jgi:hypothetical protein
MFKYIISSAIFIPVLNIWQTNGKGKLKKIKFTKKCRVKVKTAHLCHSVVARLASPPAPVPDPNGNNDSGYAASNVEETALHAASNTNSPRRRPTPQQESRQKVSTLWKSSLLLPPAPIRWPQLPSSP